MVVGVDVPATAAVASARLRLEQGDLTGVRSAFAAAARGAYDSEHGHRCERGARNEHSLRVGAQVRRIHEESLSGILGEVVGQNAFDDFAVLEFEAHPQALGSRPSREGLAEQEVGIGKIADKVNRLDVAQIDGDDVAGGVEQFEFSIDDKVGGSNVSADGIAIVLPHDDFLMSRGHGLVEASDRRRTDEIGVPPHSHKDTNM